MEVGHRASKCPDAYSDLKQGFYEGGSAGGGGDYEEDDKCSKLSKLIVQISLDANTIYRVDGGSRKSTISNRSGLRIFQGLWF
jgi:hypothetical protein